MPIEAERLRLIGDSQMNAGRWDAARDAYQRYAELVPMSGERARARDVLERIAWLESRDDK